MKPTPTLVLAVLAWVPLACGGGPPGAGSRDGSPDADAATAVEAPPDVAAPGGDDAPPDVPGAEVEHIGVPLPPGVPPPRQLLGGSAILTGQGRSTCSHQEPASAGGDRWCSFRRATTKGANELWVVNVSAAARGTVPTCDGTDANCVRLTSTLYPAYGNDFEGDTLIFYSDAPAGLMASQPFVGPVSAWRAGWKAPHVIAPAATVCSAHRNAAVAVCLDEPRGDPNNPDDVRLRVGVLADAPDPLPSLPGRWPFHGDGSIPWQLGFSPDGATFAVSVPDTMPFVQNLSVIATKDVGVAELQRNVVNDINSWTISNDGAKIYFFRGPRADATLAMADFPAGTGETTLATKVVDYIALGRAATDTTLLLRVRPEAGGRAVQLLRDRAHPETITTVFTYMGDLEGLAISPDLRYTAWTDGEFRGSAIRVSDLVTCAMNPAPSPGVSELGFMDDASYLFWSQRDDVVRTRRDGYFAPPDRCTERARFASGVGFVSPIGGRGIIYGDENDETARTVTLKYASLAKGPDEAAAGGVRVQDHATSPVTLVSGLTAPGSLHVVYTAPGGVFLFGPVPF